VAQAVQHDLVAAAQARFDERDELGVAVDAPQTMVVGHHQQGDGSGVKRVEEIQHAAAVGEGCGRDVVQGHAESW